MATLLQKACTDARSGTHKDLAGCSDTRMRELMTPLQTPAAHAVAPTPTKDLGPVACRDARRKRCRDGFDPGTARPNRNCKPMTMEHVQGELDKIESAVKTVYPMGLPPYDAVQRILNDAEDFDRRCPDTATLKKGYSPHGKIMQQANTLVDYGLGKDETRRFEDVVLDCYQVEMKGGGTHLEAKSEDEELMGDGPDDYSLVTEWDRTDRWKAHPPQCRTDRNRPPRPQRRPHTFNRVLVEYKRPAEARVRQKTAATGRSSIGGIGLGLCGSPSGFVGTPPPPNQDNAAEKLPLDATEPRLEVELAQADNLSAVQHLQDFEVMSTEATALAAADALQGEDR